MGLIVLDILPFSAGVLLGGIWLWVDSSTTDSLEMPSVNLGLFIRVKVIVMLKILFAHPIRLERWKRIK